MAISALYCSELEKIIIFGGSTFESESNECFYIKKSDLNWHIINKW